MPLPLYNYDKPQAPVATGGTGSKLPIYDYGPVPPPVAPLPPKPGFLSQSRTAFNNAVNGVSRFIAGAAEAPSYTGSKGEVLRNLPGEIVRTILPGAAALMDNPELVAQVSNKDVLKELPGATAKVGFEMLGAPLASGGLTFYGATSKYINPLLGLPAAPGVDDTGGVNIPTRLGPITNVQARIAAEPAPTNKLDFAASAAKHTGIELLNMLYAASAASKVVNPRISALTPKGQVNTGGAYPVQPAPRTFQYQEPKVYGGRVAPEIFEKIIADNNIPVRTNYNPKNPIFFQAGNVKAGGQATGQFFQVRPSYLQTFLNMFKGNPSKIPKTEIIPIAEVPKNLAINAPKPVATVVPNVPVMSVKAPEVIPPVPAVVSTPLGNLPTPGPGGFRTPAELAALKADIAANGIKEPVVISQQPDGTQRIVNGNKRIALANELGIKEVPTIIQKTAPTPIPKFSIGDQVKSPTDKTIGTIKSVTPDSSFASGFSYEVNYGTGGNQISDGSIFTKQPPSVKPVKLSTGKTLTIKPEDLKGKEKVRVMGPGNLKEVPLEIKGTRVPRPAQLITKTDLKAAIKTYPGEKAEFTVREVDGQKRLELEAEGRKVSMRPSALGLVEDNIAVGDKITITAKDLAPKGTALRAYDGEEVVASLASGFPIKVNSALREILSNYDDTVGLKGSGGPSEILNTIYNRGTIDSPEELQTVIKEIDDQIGQGGLLYERISDAKYNDPAEARRLSRLGDALAKTKTRLRMPTSEDMSLASDLKEGVVEPAKSVEELKHKIDQLNKFAQSQAILRRTGGLSTKYGGVFRSIPKDKLATHPNPKKIPERGIVHLQDSVVGSPRYYMETLAHELGHALDYTVNGSTSNTIRIFGKDLPAEVKKTIIDELKANTEAMVTKAVAQKGAGYYYKPTELFARFLENMFAKPGQVEELAPTALKYLEKSAIETPIISEYLEAVYGRIDKGERKHIFLRDMKQTYQKHLGTRVGEMAWNDEMRYRAMKERAMIQVEKLVKAKFKGVKDDPETLFRAAESIKVTKNDAPVYGTRDFKSTKNDKEAQELYDLGWEPLLDSEGNHVFELSDGEQMMRFAKPRYTPEEAKRIFDSLSPAGQQLIKDFTAAKDEAKDYFNREMIKDVHKINTDLEGWVHRYWEEKGGGVGGRQLRTKVAAAKKQRKGAEGYVEDLQKAMTKALTELETAKAYNAFIEDYFARVSKPIEKGAEPDEGWVEVQGDVKKGGVALPGEVRKIIIEDGKATPAGAVRYQMPAEIYKRFQIIRKVAVEASKTAQIMNNLNRYWRVNILFHPGSASTNFISGGIQYSAKVLTDFYVEVLTGNVTFPKTRRNIFSMLTAVTPKGWQDAPDWIYGGDLSNFYGQFLTSSTPGIKILDKSVDVYADKTLKVYGAVERYWKKVVTLSEGGSKLGGLNQMTKEGLRLPTEEEKDLLDQINKEIDLFAYDYDNVPTWLEDYQQSGIAQAVKPFAKYPYKYAKQLTEMIGAAFDGTLPWQERVAKLLTIFTIIAAYAVVREQRKKKQKTAEVDINAPASVSTAGRLFIGTDAEGNEMFTRTAKYPFLNLSEAGAQLLEGNTNTGLQVLQDMLGGVAPVGHLGLAAVGYRSEYETYIPFPALVGKDLASFVPGTRVLQDIAKFYDPYQRKPETFFQGIGSLWPTTDEALQEKLHGEKKTIQVPLEGAITPRMGEGTKRTTTDMLVQNYKNDILLGLLFGLYVKRIDPDVAAAFVTRSEENAKKKEIDDQRAALKKALTK